MSEAVTDMSSELRTAFGKWPAFPNQKALGALGHFGDGGADLRRGKELQEELGVYLIPMQCNCEIGAGLWDRITNGAWRSVLGTKAALAAAPPNIIDPSDPQADDATHLHAGDENDIARWGRIKKELARIPDLEAQLAQMREALEVSQELAIAVVEYNGGQRNNAPQALPSFRIMQSALNATEATTTYRDQIRREALEEAAKVLDVRVKALLEDNATQEWDTGEVNMPDWCSDLIEELEEQAEAIRSLAGGE